MSAVLHLERPARLLVIGARPGDADAAFGGSVARWTGEGCVAHLVCCTSGDLAADDARADPLEVAGQREQQQRAAAERLGYGGVTFLHRPEGALANDLALREQLARLVRSFRPDALAAPDPRDAIRTGGVVVSADARAAGEAALDVLEPARLAMAFPHLASAEGLQPHVVARLYLYASERATALVDIGATLETKVAALGEHLGHGSSGDRGGEQVRAAAASAGLPLGLIAAEGCAVVDVVA